MFIIRLHSNFQSKSAQIVIYTNYVFLIYIYMLNEFKTIAFREVFPFEFILIYKAPKQLGFILYL